MTAFRPIPHAEVIGAERPLVPHNRHSEKSSTNGNSRPDPDVERKGSECPDCDQKAGISSHPGIRPVWTALCLPDNCRAPRNDVETREVPAQSLEQRYKASPIGDPYG